MTDHESLIDGNELRRAVFDEDEFNALVAVWGLDEVRFAMTELAQDLVRQFTTADPGDKDWHKRAGYLSAKVSDRVRVLKMLIAQRNREESASVDAVSKKWGSFAERLAKALYLLDPSALREVPGPGDGGLSSEEWLHARVAQKARKESR